MTKQDAIACGTTLPVPPPVRIGGWLIIPAIGMVLAPVRGLTTIATALIATALEHVEIGPTFVLVIAQFPIVLYLAVMFFQRRAVVPNFIIGALGFFAFNAIFEFLDWGSARDLPRVLAASVNAAIWIPYFIISKRVKQTFVRPGWWLVPVNKKV